MLALGMDESALTDWSFPGRGADPRRRAGALRARAHRRPHHRAVASCRWASSPPTSTAASRSCSSAATPAPQCARRARCRRCSSRCKIGEREYVDGGLVSPVPVRFARQMGAELVMAVDISSAPEGQATGDAMRMLLQTFAIMGSSINRLRTARRRRGAAPASERRGRRRFQRAPTRDPGRPRGRAGGTGRLACAHRGADSLTRKTRQPGVATGL